LIVAPSALTLRGRRLAAIGQGRDEPGLVLWRTRGAPSLSTATIGVLSHNGDLVNPVQVTVFACDRGRLDLTVFAKQGVPGLAQGTPAIILSVNRLRARTILVEPGHMWHLQIATPARVDGHGRCVFRIVPDGYTSATAIAFIRGIWTPPARPAFDVSAPYATAVWGEQGTPVRTATQVVFCRRGRLFSVATSQLHSPRGPRGSTLADYVAGTGLTCRRPPQGDHLQGYATAAMHVPYGIYPYFAP
jgi:hypothetical protein